MQPQVRGRPNAVGERPSTERQIRKSLECAYALMMTVRARCVRAYVIEREVGSLGALFLHF